MQQFAIFQKQQLWGRVSGFSRRDPRGRPFSELSDEVRRRPGAAEEIDARKRAIIAAVRLAELRERVGKTQVELAGTLGMTQANVSRIERSDNLYLSTLVDYVDALGATWRSTRSSMTMSSRWGWLPGRRGGETFLELPGVVVRVGP
ncbi:MAG: XRE family transcriptional regulator [Solirubrobacterales bacterium]